MDKLDRGLVAVKTTDGVYCSWRILGEEYYGVKYNLYRDGVKRQQHTADGQQLYRRCRHGLQHLYGEGCRQRLGADGYGHGHKGAQH